MQQNELDKLNQIRQGLTTVGNAAADLVVDVAALQKAMDALIAGATVDTTTPPVVTPPVVTPPATTPALGTWSTGLFAMHDKQVAADWFAWTGRAATKAGSHVCCFTTNAGANLAAVTNPWWQSCVPAGRGLSLRVPLWPASGSSVSTDLTSMWKTIADQAYAVDQAAIIAPGWEFNLPGWSHKITAANYSAWIAAFKRAYATIKATHPTLRVVLNPNGGDDGQTGVSVTQVYKDLAGSYDGLGPDQYDCWPGATSPANIATMLSRTGGLVWHMNQAKQYGVPLVVPEWGVSSGTQWKGHTGGDNPAYITMMAGFFLLASTTGKGLMMESYFNESASYVGSMIERGKAPSQNPKAGAAYLAAWKNLPAL